MQNVNAFTRPFRMILWVFFFSSLVINPARPAAAASYTVNSLDDPGISGSGCNVSECTLREAISAAMATAGADTIQFIVDGTITLGSALTPITSAGGALTIDGGAHNVDISGADSYRSFFVNSNARLTLINLEIKDGYSAADGGGILNDGALILQDSKVTGNRAFIRGGGIYSTGVITMTNTSISSNITDSGDGGGIYIEQGRVYIFDGYFQANTATHSGGALYNRYESAPLGGKVTIQSSNFLQNRAAGGDGGAIANESELEIHDTYFSLNSAQTNGGAIYHDSGVGLEIYDSFFTSNFVDLNNGGGVYVEATGITVESFIRDSVLQGNIAEQDGGGFYHQAGKLNIERSQITGNQAYDEGGGGYHHFGVFYLRHSEVGDNQSTNDGGGLYAGDELYIYNSSLVDNRAGGDGGGIYRKWSGSPSLIRNSTFNNNRADHGGGATLYDNVDIENCTFSANTASVSGGALYADEDARVYNSILANSLSGGNCASSTAILPDNGGNNIDSGITCGWGSTDGSMSNTNPLLGSLQDNGGYTRTMMPQRTSLAVNGVDYNPPNDCPLDDQRGFRRPFGTYCDIGAVERYWPLFLPLISKGI